MEQSPFIKHLPLMFRMFNFLDPDTKQLNSFLFLLKISTALFFFFSTASCIYNSEGLQQGYLSQLHDWLISCIILSTEVFVALNKDKISALIKFLNEPLKKFEPNSVNSKIAEEYKKGIDLCCKAVTAYFFVVSSLWLTTSIVFMSLASNDGQAECIHLSIGWIMNSAASFYIAILNIVWVFISVPSFLIWYLVMFCMIIKIKFKIKLLCADFDAIDGFMEQTDEYLGSIGSSVESQSLEDELGQIPTATASAAYSNYYRNSDIGLQRIGKTKNVLNVDLQMYFSGRKTKDPVKLCMQNLVEQHLSIIEYVKLTNENFRLSIMVYIQLGVIMFALDIPKISLSKEILKPEYTNQVVEVLAIMGVIGIFNYLGQIVLDESEKLRQALYNCDWTDKPRSLRRGLLIMQIVATKPLRLTIGGIYTLSMETYSSIASAAYSYTSLIQSLRER